MRRTLQVGKPDAHATHALPLIPSQTEHEQAIVAPFVDCFNASELALDVEAPDPA